MSQSHNVDNHENPLNKYFLDDLLKSLHGSWDHIQGLFSSNFNHSSTTSHLKSFNHGVHSEKSGASSSSSGNTHDHHSIDNEQNNHVVHSENSGASSSPPPANTHDHHHSQVPSKNELTLGARKQIDMSYVDLYNEILRHVPDLLPKKIHSNQEITYDNLKDANHRKLVIQEIRHVLTELIKIKQSKRNIPSPMDSTEASQLAILYLHLGLRSGNELANTIAKKFKNVHEGDIQIKEMTETIRLMKKRIGKLGLRNIIDEARENLVKQNLANEKANVFEGFIQKKK